MRNFFCPLSCNLLIFTLLSNRSLNYCDINNCRALSFWNAIVMMNFSLSPLRSRKSDNKKNLYKNKTKNLYKNKAKNLYKNKAKNWYKKEAKNTKSSKSTGSTWEKLKWLNDSPKINFHFLGTNNIFVDYSRTVHCVYTWLTDWNATVVSTRCTSRQTVHIGPELVNSMIHSAHWSKGG